MRINYSSVNSGFCGVHGAQGSSLQEAMLSKMFLAFLVWRHHGKWDWQMATEVHKGKTKVRPNVCKDE